MSKLREWVLVFNLPSVGSTKFQSPIRRYQWKGSGGMALAIESSMWHMLVGLGANRWTPNTEKTPRSAEEKVVGKDMKGEEGWYGGGEGVERWGRVSREGEGIKG